MGDYLNALLTYIMSAFTASKSAIASETLVEYLNTFNPAIRDLETVPGVGPAARAAFVATPLPLSRGLVGVGASVLEHCLVEQLGRGACSSCAQLPGLTRQCLGRSRSSQPAASTCEHASVHPGFLLLMANKRDSCASARAAPSCSLCPHTSHEKRRHDAHRL